MFPQPPPPARVGRSVAAADAGQTPSETVYSENKLELRHYSPETDAHIGTPLLLVYAFINRPYILDLEPERSVVQQFLDRGFEVYLVDWGDPSRLDSSLGLGDFADRYLDNCVDAVRDRTDSASVNLLGYCTGATFATIFAALYPERVNALGLLAPLLNFDAEGGIFEFWSAEKAAGPELLTETFGNVPGELLGFGFSMTAPFEYHLGRYLRLLEHIDDEEYVEHFARRLRWGFDTVDAPGELHRQFVDELYEANELQTGDLTVSGERVDLSNLTMPMLAILGEDDQFVPPEASRPFLETVPSVETETIEFPARHVQLSISEAAHAELWPRVCEWFAERS